MNPKISVIIPCRNEEKYIEKCIDSILKSSIQTFSYEVIVVDGESSDNTPHIIKTRFNSNPAIKFLRNERQDATRGLNMGISSSTGDIIFILSAHATYSHNFFEILVQQLIELKADCVGAILENHVNHSTPKSESIKSVLASKIGVGNSLFRTGVNQITKVETVAYGCYWKKTFDKYGLFNEDLLRNQDIELNKRIVNGGGSIYLIPQVKASYFVRETFAKLWENNFGNGFWNIKTVFITKNVKSLSIRHFIPLFFVLSWLFLSLLSLVNDSFLYPLLIEILIYFSAIFIESFRLKNTKNNLIYLFYAFVTLHISYGFGSLKALLLLK